tara:strand:- start:577 stop:1080 length:504 start_codon:yes stop_codon:yes gene_type:complete
MADRNIGKEFELFLKGKTAENPRENLEITGVHVLNRKRTLSMIGLTGEGERKNYQFRKFTNKATKHKPRWLEIDFEGNPLKDSKITIDALRMEKDKRGKLKLEAIDYHDSNGENPTLKRAGWRGKQMSETIPPKAETVTVKSDTPIAKKTIDLDAPDHLTNQPDWLP